MLHVPYLLALLLVRAPCDISEPSIDDAVVSLLGSLGATSLIMQRQALWLEAIERRITATSAMLNSMKGVKMGGLTEVLREDLQQLRVDELNISKKFRKLLIWTMGFCRLSLAT